MFTVDGRLAHGGNVALPRSGGDSYLMRPMVHLLLLTHNEVSADDRQLHPSCAMSRLDWLVPAEAIGTEGREGCAGRVGLYVGLRGDEAVRLGQFERGGSLELYGYTTSPLSYFVRPNLRAHHMPLQSVTSKLDHLL